MPVLTMEELRIAVNPDASRLLTKISRTLTKEGIQAYLVGGFVRDALLGRATIDIDIAIDSTTMTIVPDIAAALGGKYVSLDEENGVGRIVQPDGKWQIDFTALQGEIKQDLGRRDFTINAMAVELSTATAKLFDLKNIIDPYNGRDDLARGTVRAVNDTVFKDDAVRLLRAVRIAAELGFSIDSATETHIRRQSRLIIDVPGERVREELLRLMALPGAGKRLAYLDELGLLTALIPELSPAKGVEQPRIHVWDVYEHSIQTVAALEFLLRESSWEYARPEVLDEVPWSTRLSEHFDQEISHGSTRRSLLKLAALLHDIAKPRTRTIDDDGRARFLGHPQEGAAEVAGILERLRFSNREIRLVELLVKYHLRPTQMSREDIPTTRAIYRYIRDTGKAGIDLLFLSLADHLAARGTTLDREQWRKHNKTTTEVLNSYFNEERPTSRPKLIDGHDVMKAFGLSPGPRVGELLEAVREARATGEISDRQQALEYIKKLLEKQGNNTE